MKPSPFVWRIVLVRPRNPLNIGAAARAMANFGFEDLVLVAPHHPVWREVRSAVGAEHIIRTARAAGHLLEAVEDASLVLGTTSGTRRSLDRDLIPLTELGAWLRHRRHRARARAALLFGSEKTGLSSEQLTYCHALVRIPTTPQCPSVNLGQAVAVCCYELARSGMVAGSSAVAPPRGTASVHVSEPANLHSLEHVLERAVRLLDYVGYIKPKSREVQVIKLRRLLLDLGLTNNDAKVLGGILAQIEWKLHNPHHLTSEGSG